MATNVFVELAMRNRRSAVIGSRVERSATPRVLTHSSSPTSTNATAPGVRVPRSLWRSSARSCVASGLEWPRPSARVRLDPSTVVAGRHGRTSSRFGATTGERARRSAVDGCPGNALGSDVGRGEEHEAVDPTSDGGAPRRVVRIEHRIVPVRPRREQEVVPIAGRRLGDGEQLLTASGGPTAR